MFINIFFLFLENIMICPKGLCQKKKPRKKYGTDSFHMKSNQTLYVYASSDSISKELKQNYGRGFFF